MATKGRVNIIVAPIANVSVAGEVPGGTNGVLTIDTTGGVNQLKALFPNGDTKFAVIDSTGKLAFVSAVPASSTKQYASFWQTVDDVAGTIAANNGKVLFHTPSSNNTSQITTVSASGNIVIGADGAGVYEINWGVSGAESNAFGIFINDVLVTGTIEGSGAGTQQNKGSSVLTLLAGDVVSLRTVDCAAAITLQLAGTTNVGQNVASITFNKVS